MELYAIKAIIVLQRNLVKMLINALHQVGQLVNGRNIPKTHVFKFVALCNFANMMALLQLFISFY